MHALAVGAAVGESFGFGFRRWLTVLRVAWLPALVGFGAMGAVAFAVVLPLLPAIERFESLQYAPAEEVYAAMGAFLAEAGPGLGLLFAAMVLAGTLMTAVIAVPLQRLVILGEEPVGLFHLRFDGARWRYFVVLMIVQLGALVLCAAILGVTVLVNGTDWWEPLHTAIVTDTKPDTAAIADLGGAVGLALLLGLFVYLPLAIKFALALPATAATGEMVLLGSFGLTRGNFWRILGAYILFGLAMLGVAIAYEIVVAVLNALLGAGTGLLGPVHGLAMAALDIVYQVFVYGAGIAFPAAMYRRIVDGG